MGIPFIPPSAPFSPIAYQYEYWVNAQSGSDNNSGASIEAPFASIAKALSVIGNSPACINVGGGTYPANLTITNQNLDIVCMSGRSQIVNITGTVAFANSAGSVRLQNVYFAGNVTHSGAGSVYTFNCGAATGITITKSSAGYWEANTSDFGGVASFTHSAGTMALSNTKNAFVSVTGGAVGIYGSFQCISPTASAGALFVSGSVIYGITAGGNAIISTGTSTVFIKNSVCYDSTNALTKVSLAGAGYSLDDVNFLQGASTLTAANLGTSAWFDSISVASNIFQGASSTATAGGTTTLTSSSANLQIFTGTLAQTVLLPANPVKNAQYLVINNSTGVITVKSSGSVAVSTVPAGGMQTYVYSGQSSQGGWNFQSSGGGSSTLASYALSARPTTAFTSFYNSTLGVAEFYNGTYYQPLNPVVVNQVINYAPFTKATTAVSGNGTNAAVTWTGALPAAPSVGSYITVAGVTPVAYNGTWQGLASTTTSVTFACTATGAQTVAGTIGTAIGTYIQLSGTPAAGTALGDIVYWSGTTATLVYSFANSPETIQVGTGVNALLWRKGAGTWVADGSMVSLAQANLSDSVYPLVYDNTLGVIAAAANPVGFGSVLDNTIATPPANPRIGDAYLAPSGATGGWTPNNIEIWSGSAWTPTPPVNNAVVSITSGANAGAVLIYSTASTSWNPAPNAALVIPQNSVTSPATAKGSLYEDSTNGIVEVDIAASNPTPLSYVQVNAILTATPTSSNASGLYAQSAGALPTLATGSAAISLGDIYYWNASTATAWRKYAYAQAPAMIGVGSGSSVYVAAKFTGGWVSTANSNGQTLAGQITAWGGTTLPAGALWCDGTSYSTAAYPQLFARIGYAFGGSGANFNAPDFRGVVLRGVDGVAGNDPDKNSRTALKAGGNTGNNVGSYQADQYISHSHYTGVSMDLGASVYSSTTTGAGSATNRVMYTAGATVAQPSTSSSGGNETRGKNVYVNYIIWVSDSVNAVLSLGTVQNTSFTAMAGIQYPVNTSNGALTVTLPPSPLMGQKVSLLDYANEFGTNNLTVTFNGSLFNGASGASYALTNGNQTVTFVYIDAVQGWKIADQGFTVKQTKALNHVASNGNYQSGNQFISNWSFTYTGSGRPIRVEVYPQGFTGTFSSFGFYLYRDGALVDAGSGSSNGGQHLNGAPMFYLSNAEVGAHTYSVQTNSTTQVQTYDYCTAIVTEY